MATECPGKNKWPELVGIKGTLAASIIMNQNDRVQAIVINVGDETPRDFRCDRVWVFVDSRFGRVALVPRIG